MMFAAVMGDCGVSVVLGGRVDCAVAVRVGVSVGVVAVV